MIEYTDQLDLKRDPLWETDVVDRINDFALREKLVKQYSWAIPNEEALQELLKYSPLVEIGAGTGYWAYELRKRGAVIHAYDEYPPSGEDWSVEEEDQVRNGKEVRKNWFHRGHPTWTEVQQGTPDVMREYTAEWNLFLCWPPMSEMAAYALGYHRGTYIVYVGESDGGCNADRLYFKLLSRLYEKVNEVSIPQWSGLHDHMSVFKRKGRT